MSLLSRLAVQAAKAYGMLSSKAGVSADYLVVAGGGGGGGGIGGAGGAGGMLTSTATLSTLNTYSITVGAGGSGGAATVASSGANGANSVISGTGLTTITSFGGGYGTGINGGTGGSGGSGGASRNAAGASGTSGQGNNGGTGGANSGGGGGGASAVGGNGSTNTGGNGGNGSASSISGSSVTYAGGGGGGGYSDLGGSSSSGGTGGGGGGTANQTTATSGTANLGGGGGGGGYVASGAQAGAGGAGGSGIVIISYTSATPKFVGGTITTSGGKQIHTFTSSGTLSPLTPVTASYLVVAGGGGAATNIGGGGGAGGYQASSTTLYSGATYVVTVGAGGSGGASGGDNAGSNGSNSVVSGTGLTTLTSVGGGGGGKNGTPTGAGNGGSGGGAGEGSSYGTGTSGQGNNGGTAYDAGGAYGGGGGGGASAVGANGSSSSGGNGGAGSASSISGTSTYYAGGGGGGGIGTVGSGGTGGGGNANATSGGAGSSGTPATGGGGGAGGGSYGAGGAGGSGIVIISYAGSQAFNGGLVTSSGGNTIHTFTSTGALTPLTNNVNNSLRFRSSASAFLNRTPTLAGNQQKFTFSTWLKRGSLDTSNSYTIFGAGTNGSSALDSIEFNTSTGALRVFSYNGSYVYQYITTQVFRDPSAWYHLVVAVDTTQATAGNRIKIYVNGQQVTAFTTSTAPSLNANSAYFNTTNAHYFCKYINQTVYTDIYLADVNFIDGQALEPYYFGNNDSNGVWKPILYKGTYGTNGFYLTFGNTTSTTTLGYDSSPNGNNWTTNNISLTAGTTYDAMIDSPTNASSSGTQPVGNYAVLNPLDSGSGGTISEGNLKYVSLATGYSSCRATIGMTSGKWYWEMTIGSTTASVGIATPAATLANVTGYDANGWGYLESGVKYNNNSATSYGATYTTNDIIGVAFDADAGTLVFYKNNSSQGTAFSGLTSGPYFPTASDDSGGSAATLYANFGQRPFAYTPPTGYQALCTTNLS